MRQSAYSSNEDHWDDDEDHWGDDSQSIENMNVDTDCNEGRQTSFLFSNSLPFWYQSTNIETAIMVIFVGHTA